MKLIETKVDRATFQKLQRGERLFDVRVDSPKHNIGDMMIYVMTDEDGNTVKNQTLAFRISTKSSMDEFVERIGEQMLEKPVSESGDMVVITLTPA